MAKKSKNKTPIICIDCVKPSGYFQEDFVYKLVEDPMYCQTCGAVVLDKPNFENPKLN